jgi:ABC-2 type transport system ATP-binding protein
MMLEAINLNKFYGARPALEGVSFSIGKGEVVGFLGVNGAGKSTTMRILTGFLAPTLGRALVAGLDPRLPRARERFGYLPESNPLPPEMRVGEYLRFRAGIKGMARADAAGAIADAAGRCRIDGFMERMIGQLSRGMRQRVGLADALLARPDILILDEPTAGLDPGQAADARDLIAELGRDATVFLSSHILHDIERLCRRVIILDGGRVVADDNLEAICDRNIEERIISMEVIAEEPVRELLRGIPGVRAVTVTTDPDAPGALGVSLTMPAGVDLRREISILAAQRGWLITEMRLEPVRLEDIFRRLTGK